MAPNGTLGYDVFISEPIPLAVDAPLPNGERRMFSPLSTTLIYGSNDAVLVDPPLTTDQAASVGDWIKASGKNVTHIVATHGHGDHWFTAGVLADRFDARVVASPGTIEQMHNNVAGREAVWDKGYPGQIPPSPVTATPVTDNRLTLEGHELLIVEVGHSDTDHSTVLHVPDLNLVVAGDVMYNGAHQYLAESADGGRDAWRNAIDRVRALRPQRIVASHRDKNLDDDAERIMVETRQYLDDADDLLLKHETAHDFFNAMLERYPNRRLGATILWAGAQALYAIRDGQDAISAVVGGWLH